MDAAAYPFHSPLRRLTHSRPARPSEQLVPTEARIQPQQDDARCICLPAWRNLYLITRWTPLQHYVRVRIRMPGGEAQERVCARPTVCACSSAVDCSCRMRLCSCSAHGPCCHSAELPSVNPSSLELDAATQRELEAAAVRLCIGDTEATGVTLRKPAVEVVESTYVGTFAEITVTEVLSRSPPAAKSMRETLRRDIAAELKALPRPPPLGASTPHTLADDLFATSTFRDAGSPRAPPASSELERLDLECMLSILDASATAAARVARPHTLERREPIRVCACGSLQASECVCDGDRDVPVAVAHYRVIVDTHTRALTRAGEYAEGAAAVDALMSQSDTAITTLSALRLSANAPWLDFVPSEHGTLLHDRVRKDRDAASGVVDDAVRLIDAACGAWSKLTVSVAAFHSLLMTELRAGTVVPLHPHGREMHDQEERKAGKLDDVMIPASWSLPPLRHVERRWVRITARRGRGGPLLHTADVQVQLLELFTHDAPTALDITSRFQDRKPPAALASLRVTLSLTRKQPDLGRYRLEVGASCGASTATQQGGADVELLLHRAADVFAVACQSARFVSGKVVLLVPEGSTTGPGIQLIVEEV